MYVTPSSARLSDTDRMKKASFPYFIRYKNKVDPFNSNVDETFKLHYPGDASNKLTTIYDLGIVGQTRTGALERGSAISAWKKEIGVK